MLRQKLRFEKTIGIFGFLVIFVFIACSAKAPPPPEKPPEPIHIKKLLVMPFKNMTHVYGEDATVQCRLCGNIFTTGKVEKGADKMLTDHVASLLKSRKDLELVPESQAEGVLSTILSDESAELPERELLTKVGFSLGADAVLAGKVYRFVERDGTGFSAKSPAAVAFELDLILVSDGRVVWSGHFDETQKSLFENLFQWNTFWQRKGLWITAEQLATEGLNRIFETFPVQ